jgi:hypothetical protein
MALNLSDQHSTVRTRAGPFVLDDVDGILAESTSAWRSDADGYFALCEMLEAGREDSDHAVDPLLRERGLSVPTAACRSPAATPVQRPKLSIWWLRLDVGIERISPRHALRRPRAAQ